MDEGAKKRLAGAAVVVLLLVIFAPMLLEDDVESPVSDSQMSVPPQPTLDPAYEDSAADEPVPPSPPARLPDSEYSRTPQERPTPPFIDAPAAVEPDYESEPDEEPMADIEIEPEAGPPAARDEPLSEPEPRDPEPPKVTSKPKQEKPSPPAAKPSQPSAEDRGPGDAEGSSWVIQVASVQDRKRAYSLVQDLREKGFPAYLEEAQVSGKQWNRVRVGPEDSRAQIESMAASLKKQTRLNVQIQRFR